jgi:hypothetical protein
MEMDAILQLFGASSTVDAVIIPPPPTADADKAAAEEEEVAYVPVGTAAMQAAVSLHIVDEPMYVVPQGMRAPAEFEVQLVDIDGGTNEGFGQVSSDGHDAEFEVVIEGEVNGGAVVEQVADVLQSCYT